MFHHIWRVLFLPAVLITLPATLAVSPVQAQDLAADPAPPEEPVAEQAIATDPGKNTDSAIQERLNGIYGQLEEFSGIETQVEEGVVSLSGMVPDDDAITEAERIAGRTQGVVTVSNDLERDVSVGEGLGLLERLGDRASGFVAMLPLIMLALIVGGAIGLVGYLIAGVGGLWRRIMPNVFLAELVRSAIRAIFVVGGLVIALDMVGAGALLGAVLGGAGVIGLALGFALRDTIENYVASLMLSLRQPFRANDHVIIEDMEGRIIRLTSRATVMMTLDGNHLRIPNSTVFKSIITNFTTNPQRRFEFELGVDADDDAEAGRKTGRDALAALPFVLDNPRAEARITQVGDSNVVIRFLGWVDQTEADWHKARSKAIAHVKTTLENAGFALPEPIYRLRFDERTTALPFRDVAQDDSAEMAPRRAARPAASNTTPDDHDDVAPDTKVAEMVDAERSSTSEDDLLDSSRPVE